MTFAPGGTSALVEVRVDGVRIPVGSLELNRTEVTEDGVVQRAFALRTLLGDVVVGAARGYPC